MQIWQGGGKLLLKIVACVVKANTETRCFILFKRPQQQTVHLEAQLHPVHNMSTPIISNEKWGQAIC